MTFPQPQTPTQLLRGQDQFRLTTQLQSPGDIYEVESGFKAIALGPDSDLGTLQVTYYNNENDPTGAVIDPTLVGAFKLTSQYPFPGLIAPKMDSTYPLSGRKGRTLISSVDIYDPNYKPLSDANAEVQFIVPVLDVIGWFTNPPSSLPVKRADKSYYSQYFRFTEATSWTVYPYYDRKYAFIDFLNRHATNAISITVLGVNFSTTDNGSGSGVSYHEETELVASTSVAAAGGHLIRRISAASDGMFDALVIGLGGAGPAPLRVYMSDEPISCSTPQVAVVTTPPVMI